MSRGLVALVDALCVIAFAAIGRRSHEHGLSVVGVLTTAWPFLCGAVVGWAVASVATALEPRSLGFAGVVVAAAVVVGMLLRVLTGAGTAWSFVAVATVALLVLLAGWRALARLVVG